MALLSTDLIFLQSAVMPEADGTGSVGGAINNNGVVALTNLVSPTGTVEAVSSAAGDTTQTLTIYGFLASGVAASEAKTLNGTTDVEFTTAFKHVTKATLSGTTTGNITVRELSGGSDTIFVIPAGKTSWRGIFLEAYSEESGGSQKIFYEKIFLKNTDDVSALINAAVQMTDPTSKLAFGLATSKDDSGTTTNRLTAPAGVTFGTSDASVPTGNLLAGEAIGVWLRLTLDAGDSPVLNKITFKGKGQTR